MPRDVQLIFADAKKFPATLKPQGIFNLARDVQLIFANVTKIERTNFARSDAAILPDAAD